MPAGGRGRGWSADEVARLKSMVAEGLSREQIAVVLGRTPGAVGTRLYLLGQREPGRGDQTRKARKRRSGGASFFLS
jgi:hypothetical protein